MKGGMKTEARGEKCGVTDKAGRVRGKGGVGDGGDGGGGGR